MELKQFSNALHKLRCVEQNLTKEFENSTGFSLTRYEILIYLDEKKQSLQTEIAEHIGIDPAAITRQLKITGTSTFSKIGFAKKSKNPALLSSIENIHIPPEISRTSTPAFTNSTAA